MGQLETSAGVLDHQLQTQAANAKEKKRTKTRKNEREKGEGAKSRQCESNQATTVPRLTPQISQDKTHLIPISIYIRTSNTLEIMNAWG